jgi:hypothetical protein
MAFSQIKLTFTGVPDIDEAINIGESKLGLNILEIFKIARDAATQVTLPSIAEICRGYEWDLYGAPEDEFVVLEYTDCSGNTQYRSGKPETIGYSFIFYSLSGEYTISDGIVIETGAPDSVTYNGFVSNNYIDSFNLDYNSTALFTVSSTQGAAGTGIGTVTIIANYPNAIFEVLSNTAPANFETNNYVDESENRVFPLQLSFQVFTGVANAPSQDFSIQTIGDWSITDVLPDWLEISQLSGTGNASVFATPVNYAELAVGNYTTTFDVVIGADTFTVTVTMAVVNFVKNPFYQGKLYFTQELEYLSFESQTPSTYVDINIEINTFKINTYEPLVYNRSYKFPLFQKKGDFHLGSIVHELFEEIQELIDFVPDLKSNYTKTQYRPAEITVSFEEKTYGATVPGLVSAAIPTFKMAKGFKPFMTDGQLALLSVSQQQITRITPKSFIGTSFVYFGTPRIIVKKNNVVLDDFEIEEADENKVIFSYFRFINDLKPGDSLDLIIINGLETRSQRFIVFQNGMESTFFFFENNNAVLEPYEFSGRRRISTPLKHITTTKVKKLHSYTSKVTTEISQTMIINTGQLGKEDHRVLTALVASDKVWCSLDTPDGPYFRIDGTTTRIDNQDTSGSEENSNIEFNILENANASIYPR